MLECVRACFIQRIWKYVNCTYFITEFIKFVVRANVVKAIFCFATADSTRKHARNSNKIVIFF